METNVVECTPQNIRNAVEILGNGGLVAFPTETVYGLGANALSETAVRNIFKAKGRPSDNPLIVHVSSMKMLLKLIYPATLPEIYIEVCRLYWPGPLTILLPRPDSIPRCVTASQDTVAFRIPAHPTARQLIEQCGFPLAAPSANTSGRPSPTLAQHVRDDLYNKIQMILDGGPCDSGVESTVLDGMRVVPAILRPGGITYEMIKKIIPNVVVYNRDFIDLGLEETPTTPGMKYRHYCPNAQVVLIEPSNDSNQIEIIDHEYDYYTKLGFRVGCLLVGNTATSYELQICLGDDAVEIARSIFAALRSMEQMGAQVILVQGIHESNQGLAVMNRLRKAASKII